MPIALQERGRRIFRELLFEGLELLLALDEVREGREHLFLYGELALCTSVEALRGHPYPGSAYTLDYTPVGVQLPAQDVEERRLAGPVAAHEPYLLSSLDRQSRPGEDLEVPPMVPHDVSCYKHLHADEVASLEKLITSPVISNEPLGARYTSILVILYARCVPLSPERRSLGHKTGVAVQQVVSIAHKLC
jgi:hypothetical protein